MESAPPVIKQAAGWGKAGSAEDGGSGQQPSAYDPAAHYLGGRRVAVPGLADQAINRSGAQGF
jgi:hypothetical protein